MVLGLFKIKITDEQWDKFMQFVKFCVVGLSNFIISYVVYAAALALGLHWLAGSILGFMISVLNAFYWNNKYVFTKGDGEHRSWWMALLKTYISYAFSGLLLANVLLFYGMMFWGFRNYLDQSLIWSLPHRLIL